MYFTVTKNKETSVFDGEGDQFQFIEHRMKQVSGKKKKNVTAKVRGRKMLRAFDEVTKGGRAMQL